MTDEPANDLDLLMSLDPLTYTDLDLDRIIAYQRKARAQRESGIKPKRGQVAGPPKKLDEGIAAALGINKPTVITRRR